MSWNKYLKEFEKEAQRRRYTEDDIQKCLEYAKNLFNQKLPIIYTQVHLSLLVKYDIKYLYSACNFTQKFYRTYAIPKRNGGERIISEPLPSLKIIQKWILSEILYKLKVSEYAKAYVPKMDIKSNARFHKKQRYVLSLDIENFFGSVKIKRVYRLFRKIGYSKEVASQLSHLCVLDGVLPQGAPTSPALSNLIFYRADKRIGGYCKKNKIRYTRYADDMAFSGVFNPGQIIRFVEAVLKDEELQLNKHKVRLMGNHQRQEITGIVANDILQTPREYRKQLRQNVYYIKKYGIGSHLSRINETRSNYINHLMGQINYVLYINPGDMEAREYKRILQENYT